MAEIQYSFELAFDRRPVVAFGINGVLLIRSNEQLDLVEYRQTGRFDGTELYRPKHRDIIRDAMSRQVRVCLLSNFGDSSKDAITKCLDLPAIDWINVTHAVFNTGLGQPRDSSDHERKRRILDGCFPFCPILWIDADLQTDDLDWSRERWSKTMLPTVTFNVSGSYGMGARIGPAILGFIESAVP